MTTRDVYQLLRLLNIARAARRGPAPVARYLVRGQAHKLLARWMRRSGL